MSNALADALARLLKAGTDVSASTFTPTQRQELDGLARRMNALALRPKGRGAVYQVLNRQALESLLRQLRPMEAGDLDGGLPQRATNIATHRNSKSRKAGHEIHYVLMKAVGEGVHWRGSERTLELSAVTAAGAAGALPIETTDDWHSDSPLWLVENKAVFDQTDWFPGPTSATLAYYGGELSSRLLAWLASRRRAPQIVLFADYDGVGLHNYMRLLDQCGTQCSFWLMPGWRELLTRFGNQTIWQDNHQRFVAAADQLAKSGAPDEVLELCRCMSREGLALEQEAVWHAAAGRSSDS